MAVVDIHSGERLEEATAEEQAALRARVRVPDVDDFEDQDWLPSVMLDRVMQTLVKRHHHPLRQFRYEVLWKKKGGKSDGRPIWGTCQLLRGLARYYSRNDAGESVDAVITVSADHASNYGITNYQLEAILYHELQHLGTSTDDDGNLKLVTVGHEIEGFVNDVRVYGAWMPVHKRLMDAFEQMPLIPEGYIR